MALQVTSCTLMSKPDKLLDKGARYFRSRTNSGLFSLSTARRSAVESLKASRCQFYVTDSSSYRHEAAPYQLNAFTVSGDIPGGVSYHRATNDVKACNYIYRHPPTPLNGTSACREYLETLVDNKWPFENCKSDINHCGVCEFWSVPQCQQECECIACKVHCDRTETICRQNHVDSILSETMDPRRRCSRCRSHDLETFDEKVASQVNKPRDRAYLRRLHDQDVFSSSLGSTRMEHTARGSKDNLYRKAFRRQKRCVFRSPSDFCGDKVEEPTPPRRVSRTSAELDRFFNDMGLDKNSAIESVSRRQSQSFSDVDLCGSFASLASVEDTGSVFSDCARSDNCRDHALPDPDMPKLERTEIDNNSSLGAPISVVERNARIIKWLCSVRRAGSVQSKQ